MVAISLLLAATYLFRLEKIDYAQFAKERRIDILNMIYRAQSSHVGSCLSSIDIMSVLYNFADLSIQPNGLTKDIVLIKSWNVANAYACLVAKGLLPKEAVIEYGKEGTQWKTILEPLPPYLPFGTGAMGYILPAGVGFALAKKVRGDEGKVYCIISDAEMQIGATWEAAIIAAQHKLNNLILIVDWNGFGAMGRLKDSSNVEPLGAKWEAFNWNVSRINGHHYGDIERALMGEPFVEGHKQSMPRVIIARTTKGKGVSFMENNNLWHYAQVKQDDYEKALAELSL